MTTLLVLLLVIALPLRTAAQDRSAAAFIARIEGAQPGAGPDELGALTIAQLVDRFKVPGVSIAVIVVGAEYSLETGAVDFFDGVPEAGKSKIGSSNL
jgi:hypothetical protein